MDNKIIEFKQKDKSDYEKFCDVTKSKNYVSFWFNDKGHICYSFGELTLSQMAYIEKVLSTIVTDNFKENLEIIEEE